MDYSIQFAEWQAQLSMLDKHIELGQRLSQKAQEILNGLDLGTEVKGKDLAELIKSATDALVKGAKLEADARKKRLFLLADEPIGAKLEAADKNKWE